MASEARSEPFFFGPSDRRLFACHHRPAGAGAGAGVGVLLCAPVGQEQVRSHRALRQLGLMLADAGFHTLRFDYFGTGDSAGGPADGSLAVWREDTVRALAALRGRAGIDRLAVVGLRLGATIAALVGAERQPLDALVLWEPLVSGRDYVAALRRRHLAAISTLPERRAARAATGEAMGFPLPPSLVAELEGVDLLALAAAPAPACLIVEGRDDADSEPLRASLVELGASVDVEWLSAREMWVDDLARVLVPAGVLDHVTRWLVSATSPG